jgi:hypothetical protein
MHHRVRGAVLAVALIVPRVALADDPAAKAGAEPATPGAAEPQPPADGASSVIAPVPPDPDAEDKPARGFSWEPFGYLRLQYIAVQNDPNVLFVGRDDGFELQNARIGVRGNLDKRMHFVVALDGAVDEREQVNTPQGKLRVGLRDAYVDVALGRAVAVRGGFFETVFGPDALEDNTRREFVDRPIESRGMRATEGYQTPGLTPGRSLGAAVRLDPEPAKGAPRIGFELAVQNGADEYASNNDNDLPAVSGALIVRFPKDGWLVAGARYNPRTAGELPLLRDEDDLQGMAGFQIMAGPLGLGGGVFYQRTSFPTTGGPVETGIGGHGQVTIKVPASLPLMFGYRFGLLDPSSLFVVDRVMEHTVGATLGVPAYRMRLQLQLVHVVEQGARELSNDRAQVAAEVSL